MVWDCFNVILQELWAHEFSVGNLRCSLVTPYLSSRSRRFRRVAIRVRCRDVSHTTTPLNKAPWHRNISMQNVRWYYQHVTYILNQIDFNNDYTKYIDQHTRHCSSMGVSENSGTPKSSILIGFSIINHPFWGISIFGNTHISMSSIRLQSRPSRQLLFFPRNGNSRGTRGVAVASYCLVLPLWLKMIGTFGTECTPKCLGKLLIFF